MAILENDTPPHTHTPLPRRIICHRNRTPFRNVVHMANQATQTLPPELLVKLPLGELRYRGGGWGGWRVEWVTAHTTCTQEERERDIETDRQPAYRSLQLQDRWFPWLVLKDALGLRAVLPGIYLFIWGLPLVPVERWMSGRGGVWDGREPILSK